MKQKKEILEVLKVAKDEGIISEIEFKHVDPSDKSAARYYQPDQIINATTRPTVAPCKLYSHSLVVCNFLSRPI